MHAVAGKLRLGRRNKKQQVEAACGNVVVPFSFVHICFKIILVPGSV